MNLIPSRVVRVLGVALLICAASCTGHGYDYYDQCDAAMSKSECYAARRDPDSEQVAMATDIALRWIDEHPIEDQPWDWGPGVLMFAMTELHRVTGDERIRDYYKAWLDYRIEQGYRVDWSDHCPPAITAISLLSETSTDAYEQVVQRVLHYLDDVAPRNEFGGISHLGTLGRNSIWVDSLFMFGMVLTRWGELTDDPARLAMLSEQIGIFAELLQHDDGLMQHSYGLQLVDNDIYWGRGNGWVTASLAEYLRVRLLRGESDPEAERVFRDQVRGVIELQDSESGLWWTIMNRPREIYLETSATALFAYGIARAYRYGILGESELQAARQAVEGVKRQIRTDEQGRPVVTGISKGTDPGTFEQYAAVPLGEDIHYGVGSAILALIETSGLPE
ncbi:MAG: glycoside hydrolase family 88 protein [Polyangiales bacterium]